MKEPNLSLRQVETPPRGIPSTSPPHCRAVSEASRIPVTARVTRTLASSLERGLEAILQGRGALAKDREVLHQAADNDLQAVLSLVGVSYSKHRTATKLRRGRAGGSDRQALTAARAWATPEAPALMKLAPLIVTLGLCAASCTSAPPYAFPPPNPPELSSNTLGPRQEGARQPPKPLPMGIGPVSAPPSPEEPPPSAAPRFPYHEPLPVPSTHARVPSTRIANLHPAECRAELKRSKLPTRPAGGISRGIATPLRLSGELHGVRFVTPGPSSPYSKLDCRMVLALDRLAELLASLGVVAVHVDNLYRPRAHLPGKRKPSQHAYGLAVDIFGFTLADGRKLEIERDFHGMIGGRACGPDAVLENPNPDSVELRNIVCAIAKARLFHVVLTPCYDAAHRNHLHADIKRGARVHVLH